jgi:hypothetical protein
MSNKQIVVRAGVPQPSGALVHAAYAAKLPVLFSANAFAKSKDGEFKGFNLKAAQNLPKDMDAALDSAGFVAAVRYGDYRWTTSQYYDLVASRDWAWHAAMDFCVEPPVAGAVSVRKTRLAATALGYWRCVNEAKLRGVKLPMPVLQGWFPEDYVRCAEMLAIADWPDLVGIGSVCRRNIAGPDGIATILRTLDDILPKHVKFHLFGVKGGAVKELGSHPRFASIDSMAWDYSCRVANRTGRTQEGRSKAMTAWQVHQSGVTPKHWVDSVLSVTRAHVPSSPPSLPERVAEAVVGWYTDNLLSDHGYRESNRDAAIETEMLLAQIRSHGLESLADSTDGPTLAVFEALSPA